MMGELMSSENFRSKNSCFDLNGSGWAWGGLGGTGEEERRGERLIGGEEEG